MSLAHSACGFPQKEHASGGDNAGISDERTARATRVQREDHTEVVDPHDGGSDQTGEFKGHFDGLAIFCLIASAVYRGFCAVSVTRRALYFSVASITTD
jgi:hypothetical protein